MPELGLLLFQWFVDIRSSVKGRLRRRVVLAEAHRLVRLLKDAYISKGMAPPDPPNVDHSAWLPNWQNQFCISIKHPTRRFKVSYGKCKRRTRNVTLSMCVARYAFILLYGGSEDCDGTVGCHCRCAKSKSSGGRVGCRRSRGLPAECMVVSLDQKGVMFNNTESKNTTTMHMRGSKQPVDVKTNHAQSRSRLSLCTCMALRAPWRIPPIGFNPKGKTRRVLKELNVPAGVPVIFTHSPSGSYNAEAFLEYLDQLLPHWTPERAAAADYGILLMDSYEVHKMKEVRELAWERGFIVVLHEGGITGITQWNDLDCHGPFEARLIALEEDDFNKQLELRPGRVPTRQRQTLLSDCAAIWATFAHHHATAQSAVRSGLGCALPDRLPDGRFEHWASEDHMITRDARDFWDDNSMPVLRAEILGKVYAAVQSGALTSWDQVPDYFPPPDDPHDAACEGEEIGLYDPAVPPEDIQDVASDGESVAEDHARNDGDESSSESSADEIMPTAVSAASAAPEEKCAAGSAMVPVPDESALLNAESTTDIAAQLADRLAHYDKAIAYASTHLQDEVLAKQARDRKVEFWRVVRSTDTTIIAAASARMATQRQELEEVRRKIREEDARLEAERKERREAEKRRKDKAAEEKDKKKAQHDLYMSLDRPWDPKDFGQKAARLTQATEKNIHEVLERFRLRSPPLPAELQAMWPMFLARYPAHLRAESGAAMGTHFIKKLVALKAALKRRCRHPKAGSSSGSAASVGRPDPFAEFVRAQLAHLVSRIKI